MGKQIANLIKSKAHVSLHAFQSVEVVIREWKSVHT